ncbi:nucleotidyl transferase AbiEii/AbiGii toxin family protein [Streptomyces sp. NRRL B-1347]|uniref:nucleotidyl transferase AbiEii/AbiGii toxin family protein n=1 Tax=Streptomyces sp. NRRL B-1347 TaxID=1476877 RepID=UPI0004C7C4A4|nr:nucleotidyl transferase AbiEii/AbiGii toxin family protein [Streptomyces sp. NRRL B-1347]
MSALAPRHRLVADVLEAGASYPLVLAGGHAVRAHGLGGNPGTGLGFATESPEGMDGVVALVGAGLVGRGWRVRVGETAPLAARITAVDPVTGGAYEVHVRKEALWRPPVRTEYGLALSLEDAVGTRVRALADRGLARDLVDVRAAADRWSRVELEELGRRHARDAFDLTDLYARLGGAEWIDDGEFTSCGLDARAVDDLRRWAQEWADDIAERLQELAAPEDA